MKILLDTDGHVVLRDGMPVYTHDDGKEIPFDAKATVAAISRLNGEAKGHRERAEAAEKALKPFTDAGITDPVEAAKAITTVKNLGDAKLIEAGKVDQLVSERVNAAVATTEAKYKPIVESEAKLKTALHGEKISGAFARSALIVGDKAKLAIPADLVQARFGQHFSLTDDGKVVAKDSNGNTIYSRVRHSEPADFDEALDILVDQYPHKDSILRAPSQSGSQQNGRGNQQQNQGGKTYTRAQFDAMPVSERSKAAIEGARITD